VDKGSDLTAERNCGRCAARLAPGCAVVCQPCAVFLYDVVLPGLLFKLQLEAEAA
jgi:hypothetical protein